jgi:hypothetical protein
MEIDLPKENQQFPVSMRFQLTYILNIPHIEVKCSWSVVFRNFIWS